jgi:putative methionine-R-sulfoxide reductase with GAF domain
MRDGGSWSSSGTSRLVEPEQAIRRSCEEAVARLAGVLPGREVACLVISGDSLRHVAHRGDLRLIFEVPRELGGVVWRAVETGRLQEVADVTVDPDYVASDDSVTSEIAAPVTVGGRVVAVLDVESTGPLGAEDAGAVAHEADRLGGELAPHYS